ncbi:death domain-containing protein 1 isoform X2 [Labeo rohita]|uniref:death domain-containing protein 1 isoform X2 n=1 Tax=Labeo rohita TaxID=84645 RepID=UPI0021E29168|nr:death domain-containing protein 1 isoform X2 [Labeo rohita]
MPHLGDKTTESIHRCRHYSSLELLISKERFCVQSRLLFAMTTLFYRPEVVNTEFTSERKRQREKNYCVSPAIPLIIKFSVYASRLSKNTLENMVDSASQLILSNENDLLDLLQETAEELRVLQPVKAREETGSKQSSNGHRDSAGLHTRLFQVLKTFCELHIQRVCVLREVLCGTANTLTERRMYSNLAHTLPTADVDASYGSHFFHDHVTDVILNVLEDVHIIVNQFSVMSRRLNTGIAFLTEVSGERGDLTSSGSLDTADHIKPESCDISIPLDQHLADHHLENVQSTGLPNGPVKRHTVHMDDRHMKEGGSLEETRADSLYKTMVIDSKECLDVNNKVGGEKKEKEKQESTGEDDKRLKYTLVTVGLADRTRPSESPRVCYITAPSEVANVLSCEVVDGLSSLMVSGSEELVSCVLRIQNSSHVKCPFPLTVAVPFQASYRGNYREITVKVVDPEQRVSYVTPTSTEGFYGGQRGSFAVVRVYSLGVFAVLSRLRTESFTIPKTGLSLKLSVDSRICLDYLPGSFAAPVVAQVTVQPVDAFILSSLKSKNDFYHAAVTSTPLLYLSHPSTLKLRRPMTLVLPCPPISDKRRAGEETDRLLTGTFSPQQIKVDGASVKTHKESKEHLALLGWTENRWKILDKVSVKNLQNSLVCFELTESYERLIVLRFQSSLKTSYIISLVEELEEALKIFPVTVVLHHERLDPSSVVLATLPSRDVSWALCELQTLGYCGPPEPSSELSMKEGEQLMLKFSGNITCNEPTGNEQTDSHIITFHNQRRHWLYLELKEVDPFGNYISLHYKGVISLFKVAKDQLVWNGDRAAVSIDCPLGEPVCRLPLTLPKSPRKVFQPVSVKVIQHNQTEPLSDELLSWLCDELTEDDAALLITSLHLRRSAVQIARLRAPHSLSQQSFHVLTAWRRGLPSSTLKCPMLARCLTRVGRPDLARELLLREAANDKMEEKKTGETSKPCVV